MKQAKVPFKKRMDNFFYHYKLHTIIGFILLIFIGSVIYTTTNNQIENYQAKDLPPADIEILLFGDYKVGIEQAILENNLQATFPEWETINLSIEYAPSDTASHEDIAAMQRSLAVLHTETPDIYIFDRSQFDKFIEDGTFTRLDDYFSDEKRFVTYQKQVDEQPYVYGIDITDSPIFSEIEISEKDKIAIISNKTLVLDNALHFIKQAIK